ncbi:MAG: hypothetical protein M3Q14_04595 [bacterium]|nr:hypothetical protein [bacterium]
MQNRNPLFVAGFPYALIMIGYYVLLALDFADGPSKEIQSSALFPMFGALIMIIVGAGYTLYWMISTARVLRRKTNERIPNAILLVIPFASYWWIWRYGKAVEVYTKGKTQSALTFVLLALLGPIGMGVLQDIYNKMPSNAVPSEPNQL